MKRADLIFEELQRAITAEEYGRSGSVFMTVRELAQTYSCSLHCALDVFQKLTETHLIRSIGKRNYITTGPCANRTPLEQYLADHQRNLFGILIQDNSNPFFGSLINHLHTIATQYQQQIIVSCSNGESKREREILDLFWELNCKGVFNCVPVTKPQEHLFRRYPLPLVTLAEETHLPNMDTILVNNYTAGTQIAKHLIKNGCRSFAYITEANYIESDQRLKGFRDYLRRNQFDLPDEHIGVVTTMGNSINTREIVWFATNILNHIRQSNTPLPLGIFCVHDLLAVEIARVVKHYHSAKYEPFYIPDDVMIVGFDDLPIANMVTPTLTTVSYQYSTMAETAFRVMMDYVTNPYHVPKQYEVNSSLIVRESTTRRRSSSGEIGI